MEVLSAAPAGFADMSLSIASITCDTVDPVALAGLVGRRGVDSFRWVTLTDAAGNEFCVAGPDEIAAASSD